MHAKTLAFLEALQDRQCTACGFGRDEHFAHVKKLNKTAKEVIDLAAMFDELEYVEDPAVVAGLVRMRGKLQALRDRATRAAEAAQDVERVRFELHRLFERAGAPLLTPPEE